MGELQPEDRDAAGALQQDGVAGLELGVLHHGVPGGDAGAGQRRALVERQMRGNFHDAVLFQHHIFRQHAVDAAAERRGVHVRARLAARPALEEMSRRRGRRLRHAGPDFDHFAGAVRQRKRFSRTGIR